MLAHDHLLPAGGTRSIVMHRVCMYELAREERATVSVALQLWMDLVGGEVRHSKCAHSKGY